MVCYKRCANGLVRKMRLMDRILQHIGYIGHIGNNRKIIGSNTDLFIYCYLLFINFNFEISPATNGIETASFKPKFACNRDPTYTFTSLGLPV